MIKDIEKMLAYTEKGYHDGEKIKESLLQAGKENTKNGAFTAYQTAIDKYQNMENNTTVPNLNERIFQIINSHSDAISESDTAIDDFKYKDLSNAIEKLIIQQMIDVIDEATEEIGYTNSDYFKKKRVELINQLNNIK